MKYNMINKIFTGVVCLMLFSTCSTTVFAVDSSVKYVTNSKKFDFSPESTDLFQNFKGIMPGDNLSQTFAVSNDQKYGVRVNIYLRAKPIEGVDEAETQKYNEFLRQLKLSVTQEGNINPLFDDKANAQGTLKDNVLLGTFYPGAKTNFNVNLKVPIELENEFQDASGKISWIFTAEERPVPPPYDPPPYYPPTYDPTPVTKPTLEIITIYTPSDNGGDLQTTVKSPKTGDSANIILPIILMVITALVIILLLVTGKKKRNNKYDIK